MKTSTRTGRLRAGVAAAALALAFSSAPGGAVPLLLRHEGTVCE
jgi:hypothetical protein